MRVLTTLKSNELANQNGKENTNTDSNGIVV